MLNYLTIKTDTLSINPKANSKSMSLFKILTFFFVSTYCSCFGQDILIYHQLSPNKIKHYEKSLNSIFEKNDPNNTIIISDEYLPNASKLKLMQPLQFKRPDLWEIPGCKVEYYLTEKDSVVKLMQYDCIIRTNSTIIRKKDEKRFDSLYLEITKHLGNPVKGGYEPNVKNSGQRGIITEHRIEWKKGNTNLQLIMSWTRNNEILWTRIKIYWL